MSQQINIRYKNQTRTIREWSDRLGMNYHTLLYRLRRGWSISRAIETPLQGRGGGAVKHGRTGSKEYRAWLGMIFRCENPQNNRWHRYGGRGISVHRAWRLSFEKFVQDVGFAPSAYHSLGRLDHDRNYEPGNVAWQTTKEQVECWKESRGRGRK